MTELVRLQFDHRSGLWHRPRELADDLDIIAENRGTYRLLPIREGDTVLDLGAHIGASVQRALDLGAGHVIAVEPDPENLVVLRANVAHKPVTVIAAAVTRDGGTAELYVNDGRGKCMHSVVTKGKKHPITVPAVTLESLLQTYRPDVVKCDVEVGEYDLPELLSLPSHVRVLAMEVHLNGKWRQPGIDLIDAIEGQGFVPIKKDNLTPKAWSVDAIWDRAEFLELHQ